MSEDIWQGLNEKTRARLQVKSYTGQPVLRQLATTGVEFGSLIGLDRTAKDVLDVWIPGVEIMPRRVFSQRHRGVFSEFGRQEEGVFGQIQMWPRQWATARMFAGTAKGFHIHPPYLEPGVDPVTWFQRLFTTESANYSLRPYEREQWDAMFFIQGRVEMLLVDERAGMPRKVMRVFIDGDNYRGTNNGGIVIPPGVAHALRAEGSEDLLMVYGTSTAFVAENEGRIASDVELAPLPRDWDNYLNERS